MKSEEIKLWVAGINSMGSADIVQVTMRKTPKLLILNHKESPNVISFLGWRTRFTHNDPRLHETWAAAKKYLQGKLLAMSQTLFRKNLKNEELILQVGEMQEPQ